MQIVGAGKILIKEHFNAIINFWTSLFHKKPDISSAVIGAFLFTSYSLSFSLTVKADYKLQLSSWLAMDNLGELFCFAIIFNFGIF